ncbi:hypothetical protein ABIA31_000475 [Catenulispora sp. MAP5-51]|uniref:hypothetical protein n=1 Tax=Catenulispora sp. MAP5-51 TaxID=3156298 RepID=UPI0035188640
MLIVIMVLSAAGYTTRQAVAPCWPDDPVRTDPHAYHRNECSSGWTNSSTNTLTGALQYYGLALPPAASDVRYYSDDDSFNGPDTLLLHFSVGAPGMAAFLKTLAASPAAKTPAEVTSGTFRSQSFVEGLGPDWDKTATAGSAVYQWDGASSGNVIIERRSTDTVVILVIAVAMR